MVLNFIKPDKTADFEAVMAKLKEALQKSEKPERKQQAASWKVFKSPEPAGANVLYVFVIDPAVKDADYTVSNILAEAFPPAELNTIYKQYADSYAQGQNIINLNLITDSASRAQQVRRSVRLLAVAHRRQTFRSEFQIQSRIDAVRWRVQRTASQLEHAVVDAHPQRSDQRDLHSAARVVPEARSVRVPSVSL